MYKCIHVIHTVSRCLLRVTNMIVHDFLLILTLNMFVADRALLDSVLNYHAAWLVRNAATQVSVCIARPSHDVGFKHFSSGPIRVGFSKRKARKRVFLAWTIGNSSIDIVLEYMQYIIRGKDLARKSLTGATLLSSIHLAFPAPSSRFLRTNNNVSISYQTSWRFEIRTYVR